MKKIEVYKMKNTLPIFMEKRKYGVRIYISHNDDSEEMFNFGLNLTEELKIRMDNFDKVIENKEEIEQQLEKYKLKNLLANS